MFSDFSFSFYMEATFRHRLRLSLRPNGAEVGRRPKKIVKKVYFKWGPSKKDFCRFWRVEIRLEKKPTDRLFCLFSRSKHKPLQNGACVLDFGPQFLPRRADDSCPVVSFVSPCTLPRTERIMFMKYMLFALKMHSNRSFQFFSSGATCLTTSGIFETVHSTILPFALQEHRRRGRIVTLRSRSSTHAPFLSG